MYKVNENVLYTLHGLCKITEISEKCVSGVKTQYYHLKPIYDEASTIFIPVDNENLTIKMHALLTESELQQVIEQVPSETYEWIENEGLRKQLYKELLNEGNRENLIRMVKTLFIRQELQRQNKKTLSVADKYFLKIAEKSLSEELAFVLKIDRNQVPNLIRSI